MASESSVTAAVVGGLIVGNGRHRGTRVPLKLPVTVIGAGDGCDVRLTADGIAPLHCVVAVTPAGPTLRSWHADSTLVNGRPTTAAVLAHGDEVTVGPCRFRLAWFGELNAAEPVEPTALAVAAGPEWQLHEREQSLHEQEKQLATLLEGKQRQVESLLDQLADKRDEFHAEKANAKRDLAAARAARRDAEALRAKHHGVYRKLVLRAKRQRLEGERANAAEAAKLKSERQQLERDRATFDALRAAGTTELNASKQRLQDAWTLLDDGQRRLLADRREAERHIAEVRTALDAYAAELNQRDATMADAHAKLEARCGELQAELIGLDRRAMHAQAAVHDLELQRAKLEAAAAPAKAAAIGGDLVPLNAKRDRGFDELMADLTTRERELDRELKVVAGKKADFDRLAGELADQRSVLVAQFLKLTAAARLWQREEVGHAGELEQLAVQLEQRERSIVVREQRALVAEDQCRQRERDLWAFRVKLEGWQAGLTAHEAQWYAQRDGVDAEVDRQREHLAQWEASLTQLRQTWADVRSKERDAVLAEIDAWARERSEYAAARATLDDERIALAREAKHLAARMTATEEAAATADPKRLRVLQKKWESHFRRFEKLWEARHAATAKLAKTLEATIAEAKAATAKRTDAALKAAAAGQAADVERIAARRTAEPAPAARPRRADRELIELRGEVERVAAVLMNAPMATGDDAFVALMPAKAA